ncbi:hypothetical protein D3C85_1637180 [compost metagenome]
METRPRPPLIVENQQRIAFAIGQAQHHLTRGESDDLRTHRALAKTSTELNAVLSPLVLDSVHAIAAIEDVAVIAGSCL